MFKNKAMFTIDTQSEGASLITAYRNWQLDHGYTLDYDKANNDGELASAAVFLINPEEFGSEYPEWWPTDRRKRYEELNELDRLIISGAYIAARIDQIKYEQTIAATNAKSF
jgi:hypothetical protein